VRPVLNMFCGFAVLSRANPEQRHTRKQKGTRAQLSEHAVAHHDVDDYNLDNYDTAARAATPAASNGPSYPSRVTD